MTEQPEREEYEVEERPLTGTWAVVKKVGRQTVRVFMTQHAAEVASRKLDHPSTVTHHRQNDGSSSWAASYKARLVGPRPREEG